MGKAILAGFVSGMLVVSSGCATNSVVGSGLQKAGKYSGNVGVTGHNTHLTIQRGSVVPKLSIIGDKCEVIVEDGAELGRIEFWGNGSSVSVPSDMVVWVSEVGNNSFIRRPPSQSNSAKPKPAP